MGWGVSGCGCGCGVVLFRYVCESGVRARVSGMIMYLLIHDKSAKITNVKRSELLAASKLDHTNHKLDIDTDWLDARLRPDAALLAPHLLLLLQALVSLFDMTSCSSSSSLLAANPHTHTLHCPRTRHILSGTFNTPHLHLLRFDTLTRALTPVHPAPSSATSSHNANLSDTARLETRAEAGVPPEVIPARGPHQFLTLGKSTRSPRACGPSEAASQSAQSQEHELPNRVYATTWAEKAQLSAWEVVWGDSAGKGAAGQHGDPSIRLINSVPISEWAIPCPNATRSCSTSSSRLRLLLRLPV